jgi:hypothetical protein
MPGNAWIKIPDLKKVNKNINRLYTLSFQNRSYFGTSGLKEVFTDGRNEYIFRAAICDSCLNVMRSVLSNLPSSILPSAVLREDYERRFSFDAYIKRFEAMLKKSE